MKTFLSIASLAAVNWFAFQPASAQVVGATGTGWSIRGSSPIMAFYGGNHVTSYHPGYEEGKPFFYPVIGPTGENMTRHWPMKEGFDDEADDHIHHRGMWYGLGKVNGLDFWHFPGDEKKREGRQFGVIRHKGMNGVSMSKDDLVLKLRSEWKSYNEPEKRILSDQREFRFFYRKDGALVIDATFKLIADAGDVKIQDDKEGAWSIRTIPTLRLEGEHAKGQIVNSEGITNREAWGKRANWVDYYGVDRRGNAVGIAILDHPSNFRHPTWWHARHYGLFTANPFGQGNFEEDAEESAGDYVIENGKSLTFRYRTIFHEGDAESANIAQAFEDFSAR
ncbi:MAG: PmoA family protein [Verrucomicrobiota bacterium]